MRAFIIIAILGVAFTAFGQICATIPDGYERSYRPQGEAANYPAASEPACLWYVTSGVQP